MTSFSYCYKVGFKVKKNCATREFRKVCSCRPHRPLTGPTARPHGSAPVFDPAGLCNIMAAPYTQWLCHPLNVKLTGAEEGVGDTTWASPCCYRISTSRLLISIWLLGALKQPPI